MGAETVISRNRMPFLVKTRLVLSHPFFFFFFFFLDLLFPKATPTATTNNKQTEANNSTQSPGKVKSTNDVVFKESLQSRKMRACALCKETARAFCESDQASLCWSCDSKVHGANFLVARHSRTLLCHACQSPSPWKASGPKLGGRTVSFCDSCLRRRDSEEGRGDNEDDEDEDDDDEEEERSDGDESGGGDGDEMEEEDEDGAEEGDNQVVPWSSSFSAATPPPPASCSSSEEDDLAGRGRSCCGTEWEVDEVGIYTRRC